MKKYDNYLRIALGDGDQSVRKIKQFKKNYVRFFPKRKTDEVLDIGPGKGEMLTCLSTYGYKNIQGVDISESVVNFCKLKGFQVFHTLDLSTYLTNGQQYSLITMCDVVEHIPKEQILDVLTNVHNALREDGVLIVQVPNMQSITANIFRYDDFTHETGYTERSLIQVLTLCGFSTVNCYGFEFLDNSFRSKIHFIIRKIVWCFVKLIRKINGTMPHSILHPVFFAVAKK